MLFKNLDLAVYPFHQNADACLDAIGCDAHTLLWCAEAQALDRALEGKRDLCERPLLYFTQKSRELHPASRAQLATLAGSYLHHALFFDSFSCEPTQDAYLQSRILATFGSMECLEEAMLRTLPTYPDYGWIWIYTHKRTDRLGLLYLHANEVPSLELYHPLVCIDLWEHAYYSTFGQNQRAYLHHLLCGGHMRTQQLLDTHTQQRYTGA